MSLALHQWVLVGGLLESVFRLDTMSSIASLLQDQIRPGESISIAKSVLSQAYSHELKPGKTLGDILIDHIPGGYQEWSFLYKHDCDCFQFKRHRR